MSIEHNCLFVESSCRQVFGVLALKAGRILLLVGNRRAEIYGLSLPETLAAERRMWGAFTAFVYWGDPDWAEVLDTFRKSQEQLQLQCPWQQAGKAAQ
jgi:hypothetical protein